MTRFVLAAAAVLSMAGCALGQGQIPLAHKGISGCTAKNKCGACYGDCDNDVDCKTGLQCFQRNDASVIHGCKTGGSGDVRTWDYCYSPTQKVHYGVNGCTAKKKCGQCAGDCDRDTDCKTGLKCYQRNGKTLTHGCKAGGKGDVTNWDYCYDPSWLHTMGWSGCTTKKRCSSCQGDCDGDRDCKTGLKCFQRSAKQSIPGCKLTFTHNVANYDFCYAPGAYLISLGVSGCTTRKKCAACYGDCDRDADCKTGLQCFQRNDATIIHGCMTGGKGDVRTWDYCYSPTTKVNYGGNGCTAKKKCSQCQGDCDRDTDCKTGLKCWQRNNKVAAHGCKSGGKGDVNTYDYCYSPSAMHSKGVSGCRANAKCSKCQGDCDRDTDCKTGLKCFQRNGLQRIPGCKAGTTMDVRGWDYCYPAPVKKCPGDIAMAGKMAKDNKVDVEDLLAVLANFACNINTAVCKLADVTTGKNGSSRNKVDVEDLLTVLANYGKRC